MGKEVAHQTNIIVTSLPEAPSKSKAFPDVWYARICAVIGTAFALSLPMVRIGTGLEDRPLLEEPWLRLMYCAGLVNVLFLNFFVHFALGAFSSFGWVGRYPSGGTPFRWQHLHCFYPVGRGDRIGGCGGRSASTIPGAVPLPIARGASRPCVMVPSGPAAMPCTRPFSPTACNASNRAAT